MWEARKKNNLVDTTGKIEIGLRNENLGQLQASVEKEEPFYDGMGGIERPRYRRRFLEFNELEP